MDQNEPIDGVKQNAEGYSDAEIWGDNWTSQADTYKDASWKDKAMYTMPLWGLTDEAQRFGASAKQYGLPQTLLGKGNLGGFRSPVLDKAGQAIANPSVTQRLGSQRVNAGFAGMNIGSGLAAGYQELSGRDFNPYTALFDRENFGENEMIDDQDNPILNPDGTESYELDENGEELLDENGDRIQRFEKKSRFKGVRSAALGSRGFGVGEAILDDLMIGGYDAFKGNSGFAEAAQMFGLGGDWSREVIDNARKYVADRQDVVQTDPLGTGAIAEVATRRINDIYNDFKYPKSEARIESEKKPYGPSQFPSAKPMTTPRASRNQL